MRKTFFWKRILLLTFFSAIVLTFVAGAALYAFVNKIQTPVASQLDNTSVITDHNEILPTLKSSITILLIGVDDGDPDTPNSPRHSDTMMVANINFDNNSVNLLSIPRDSRVKIPGYGDYDKINHAYFYGGTALAVRTVENLLAIPINYYVIIDWKSFIKVIDILGGVNLTIAQDMNYDDPYENLSIHLVKGNQHLDGEKSGEYVRYRHDELGDIGRVERQQYFLKTLTNQILQPTIILKVPALLTTISQYVHTDMNFYVLAKIGNMLRNMKSDSLHTEMLPGDFATIDDISYWLPDNNKKQALIQNMFGNTPTS